jgi:hypothetical protein
MGWFQDEMAKAAKAIDAREAREPKEPAIYQGPDLECRHCGVMVAGGAQCCWDCYREGQ